MYDIDIVGDKLLMKKGIWDESELFLASCLWWDYNPSTGMITADLNSTLKKSVKEFLNMAYPTFMNNITYQSERNALSKDLKTVYSGIESKVSAIASTKVPYWNKMYQHQREATIAMYARRVTFLAFQQRVGKSLTMMSHSLATSRRRTVIVCMDVGKWNYMKDMTSKIWNDPVEAFSPYDFTILDSQKRKCVQAFHEKYVIVNYEAMPKYMDYIVDGTGVVTDHIVFDECQAIKNTSSARHRLADKLIDSCPDARITLMSGTPVMNRLDDMFAYFKLSRHPLGANRKKFDDMFIRRSSGRYSKVIGSKDSAKLFSMSSNFMIRKRLDECSDIPAKSHVKMYYPIGDWKEQYMTAVHEAIMNKGSKVRESSIHSINNIMAQAKIPGTFDFIKQLVDQDEKVVVFTSYSEPLNKMEQLLVENKIKYVRIDGSIDGKEKVSRAFAFNEDPEIMVAICNMKAAGHSINLSAASYINVINYPLSPMELDQAIFRTDTVDKKNKTTVYYSTCVGDDGENTVDMRLADLNESKVQDINNFVDKGKDVDDILNATDAIYSEILKQYGNDNDKQE